MSDPEEDDEDRGGPPRNCSSCRKEVLNGQGIQVETKTKTLRFCARCYTKECDKIS
jgi:ribosomal protein L24E